MCAFYFESSAISKAKAQLICFRKEFDYGIKN